MPTHKSNDYKLTAVQYYLVEDKTQEESNECKLCCMDRDINASKNILLLLQCEKQGKRRPKCFREK